MTIIEEVEELRKKLRKARLEKNNNDNIETDNEVIK